MHTKKKRKDSKYNTEELIKPQWKRAKRKRKEQRTIKQPENK